MEPATARITARSKRQAMDWSLVLMSQGIVTSIEFSDQAGWELVVAPADYQNALQTLHLYQKENQWPWRRRFLERGLIFDWSSLVWGVLVCFFYLFCQKGFNLTGVGLMDSEAVRHGQWWRLFTAIWLHADLAHLASNVTLGIVLLGLAMARYGTGVALLISYLAGGLGNFTALALSVYPHHSLGASGMVMGALGLLAVHSFYLWRRIAKDTKYVLVRLISGLMLFLLLGVAPGSDILAHAGGFFSGVLLGSMASLAFKLANNSAINLLCGLLFAALVAWPWWLAVSNATFR